MDWWLIPAVLAVAVLARLLWVAVFRPDETGSAMPELDGHAAREPGAARRDGSEVDYSARRDGEAADDGGIWIELDIEPLFPSSERQIVDLTEEQDPEVSP